MTTKYTYEEMCDYLFKWHAPNFNFERGGEELLEIALQQKYIKRKYEGEEPYYVLNEDY
jgi:hypothetical protein